MDRKNEYSVENISRNSRAALPEGRYSRMSAMTTRLMEAMSTLYKAGIYNTIMFFIS